MVFKKITGQILTVHINTDLKINTKRYNDISRKVNLIFKKMKFLLQENNIDGFDKTN